MKEKVALTNDDPRETRVREQDVQKGQEKNARDIQHWLDWVSGKRTDPPVMPF